MAGIFFLGTLSILASAAAAAGVTRPNPPDGWVRVGCVQIDRQDFPVEFKPVSQDDCISRCGSSKTGSHFAAIGDVCRCASKSLDGISVVTSDDDRCKAFCYIDDPDVGTCGALMGGIQYYDLYKQSSDDITVTKKPGYPPPIGTVATAAQTKATDSESSATESGSASASSTIPDTATAASNKATTASNTATAASNTAKASETSTNAGSNSNPFAFGAVLTATLLIIASFIV
ncbi:hypothetical protein EDB80DRAFT_689300 [Ilyonectria destructans]|nr:hypothetical protein EDB80DRAFT_689300 [Ilyonectria destructans]